MRSLLTALLATAALARGLTAQPAPKRPTLVVFIAIDQLRPDYFDRWRGQLTGGLHRLWTGGAVMDDAWYDYAITETAPGHGVMMSGRWPYSTGIVLNDEGVPDARTTLIGSTDPGASPYRFRGSVLMDWIRNTDARSRALSVSRKDRGAILPLGHSKPQAFWWSRDAGFTTSRWYADTLPTWVRRFNAEHPATRYAAYTWTPLLADSAYRERDDVAAEAGGKGSRFPLRVSGAGKQLGNALEYTPLMDSLTLELALTGLQELELGRGPQVDLLNISLSTVDAVGHKLGPDSRELHDMVLRVDRLLGDFFTRLYALRDSTRVLVALTSDHAISPYPTVERSSFGVVGGEIVNDTAVVTPVRAALVARGVPASWMLFTYGMLRLESDSLRAAGIDPDSLTREVARVIAGHPAFARVATRAELARGDTLRDDFVRRWRHNLPPDEPVTLVASLKPGNVFSRYRETGHANGHPSDAHVPIVLYGPWFMRGRHGGRAHVVDIAPTMARVLGVQPTQPIDGRVLERALVPALRKAEP